MGSLDGEWVDRVVGHSIVPAGEGDPLTLKQTLDDGDRLGQPLDSGASRIEA